MPKLISNGTGQILIPAPAVTGIVIQPVNMASELFLKVGDSDVAKAMGDGYRSVVEVTMMSESVRFRERYLSHERANSDIVAAMSSDAPLAILRDPEYADYASRYKKAASSLSASIKSAYADSVKGGIK